jgi:hypothetical protein
VERHQVKLLRAELGLDPPPPRAAARPNDASTWPLHDHQAADVQDTQDLTPQSGAVAGRAARRRAEIQPQETAAQIRDALGCVGLRLDDEGGPG